MFDKSFFLLDSSTLSNQNSGDSIFGYHIDNNGKTTINSKLPEYTSIDEGLFWLGVNIRKCSDITTIKTDSYGMGIIFYYQDQDGYYAISNSFHRLFLHLNGRVELTSNLDYLALFNSVKEITTISFQDTPIKEIKILPQNDSILIKNSKFGILKGKSVEFRRFDSLEGLKCVDRWADKWIDIMHLLVKNGQNVNIQLSGGFDSRVILALAIKSGIDLDKVNIESSLGMKSDLAIATEISEFYGFELNKKLSTWKKNRISNTAALELNKLSRLGIHKEFLPAPLYSRHDNTMFQFAGWGGTRAWIDGNESEYVSELLNKLNCPLTNEIESRIKNIINHIYKDVSLLFNSSIDTGNNFLNFAYNYTRGRWNYGTTLQAACSMNQLILPPIFGLSELNPIDMNNEDFNLIYTYIYYRFAPDLLKFKFTGNRKINEETIAKAMVLNKKPYSHNSAKTRDKDVIIMLGDELSKKIKRPGLTKFLSQDHLDGALKDLKNMDIRHREKSAFGVLSLSEYITPIEIMEK